MFSVSSWGHYTPWAWGRSVANLWRVSGDLDWDRPPAHPWQAMLTAVDIDAGLARYAGPGAWNDLDMLPVGAARLSTREMRSAFSLWSILASPLVAGNDVRTMPDATRDILTNAEVIAIDQDPAGLQGTPGGVERAAARSGSGGCGAAIGRCCSSTGAGARRRSASTFAAPDWRGRAATRARELWTGRRRVVAGAIRSRVPSHGVALFRVSRGH